MLIAAIGITLQMIIHHNLKHVYWHCSGIEYDKWLLSENDSGVDTHFAEVATVGIRDQG